MGNLLKQFNDPKLPQDYFRVQIPVLRYLGIEMYKEESSTYKFFSILFLLQMTVIFVVLEIYELFYQFGLEKFSKPTIEVANYALTHTMSAVEIMLIYINRKNIGKMIIALHNPPFAPDASRGGASEAQWIRAAITKTELIFIVCSIFLFITIMSSVFEWLYYCIVKPRAEWGMPFATMSLGAIQRKWPFFEISVAYQVFQIITFAAVTLTSYLLICAIMAHIGVQLRIMANSLRYLKPRAVKQARDVGNFHDDEFVVNKKMEALMRAYIKHHLDVLNLAVEMESLCSLMILLIFLFSVLLMCFILFFASLYPIGSFEFYHFFFYWWCVACQVGSYCYWGNELSEEAAKIAEAAAEIDWPGASKTITIAVKMIMIRAQRPVYITAGKFVPLSLETLMAMVKGSFSYFMVLKQTQDEIDEINI